MDDSMAQGAAAAPAWKSWLGTISAVLLAALFLISGFWKLVDPLATSSRMVQALVPPALGLAAALGVGVLEAWSGVMLLVPRWRRWGAYLSGFLLVVFMIYIGWNYTALQGEDCSCFPWLKRMVGPMFFISDAAMLLLAAFAALWSRPPESLKRCLAVVGALAVFGLAVTGVVVARQTGVKAPDTIAVAGKPVSLQQGKVFIFFFDPQCAHCFKAAVEMSKYKWAPGVKTYTVATVNPQWAEGFLKDTGFQAGLTPDLEKLRAVFTFTDPPFGVAIEHGREVQAFPFFDEKEPSTGLRQLGYIQ